MIENVKASLIPKDLHAFFTNKAIDFNENSVLLDFSFSEGPEKKNNHLNQQLAISSLGGDEKKVRFVKQVHSSKVLLANSKTHKLIGTADAMVSKTEGIILAILTADCAPVFFFDPVTRIIGAAHAGWRGALFGVIENTIDAMITIGAKKKNIVVAIGPCISKDNYEVGKDFKAKVLLNSENNNKFFSQSSEEKYLFDLSGFIADKLEKYGIKSVEIVKLCTYQKSNNFHSYRHARHGGYNSHQRNISLITL